MTYKSDVYGTCQLGIVGYKFQKPKDMTYKSDVYGTCQLGVIGFQSTRCNSWATRAGRHDVQV